MTASTRDEYTTLAKWLHWLIAGLILVQYMLIELAQRADHANQVVKELGIIANHKSIGITILLFAIIRLAARAHSTPPRLPDTMPKWQVSASHLSHFLLYFCLFALPISGWLMSSANAYSVSWFNVFALPDLIEVNKHNAELLSLIHERLADALIVIAAIHVLAALKHGIIDRDSVLTRMLSKTSITVSVLMTCVLIITLSGQLSHNQPIEQDNDINKKTHPIKPPITYTPSQLPIWKIDYTKSHITFTGEQAGAPFTGQWNQWQGTLQFDSNALDQSQFDVSIEVASVASNDDERDETILSVDFFDVMNFPTARFQANQFSATQAGFVANGYLIIKNLSHPTDLAFKITKIDNEIILGGTAVLNRHAWEVGIRDWADPTWVGSEVTVNVLVTASTRDR